MANSPYKVVLSNGRFDTEGGSGPENLTQTLAAIKAERTSHLVIHLHGGLISRQAGEAAATRLDSYYREAGVVPFFLIWESGWQEVLGQRLKAIAEDLMFRRILGRVTQFVRGKFDKELGPEGGKGTLDELSLPPQIEIDEALARGLAGREMFTGVDSHALAADAVSSPDADGLDLAERQQIETEIENDLDLQIRAQAIESEAAGASVLMDEDVLRSLGIRPEQQGDKGILSLLLLGKRIADVVGRAIWRFAHRRDHGIYLTIVEEVLREFYVGAVGKFLWDGMKNAVANAFAAPDAGGTLLVAGLRQAWLDGGQPMPTLVGHSAGAIYAARLLRELHSAMPAEFRVNLVLIAPACTFEVLWDALKEAGSRIAGMRVFGMGDEYERKDAIASMIYPASLLYFVAGVLEAQADAPLAGMQRYYRAPYDGSDFPAIAGVQAFTYLARDHALCWSMMSGHDGANSDMVSHGGWLDAEATRQSVMSLLRQGYGYA